MIHLFKKIAITLLIIVSFQTTAQNTISKTKVDSLLQVLHLPNLDSLILIKGEAELYRVEMLWRKNNRSIKNNTLLKLLQKIERSAVANKNSDLEMKAAIWLSYIKQSMYSQTETTLGYKKLIKRAGVSNVFWAEMEARLRFANYLVGTKNPQSIESGFWILKENIDKINKKEDANLSRLLLETYAHLISCYYSMEDLSNAIIYSKKALDIKYPRGHTMVSDEIRLITVVLNNLGVFYREQQKLDASTYYFRKVFNLSLKENDTVFNAVSSGNLGENLYLQDNFQEALPLLQKDADMTTKIKHWGSASNALILIADIYLREGDIEKAKQTIDKAAFAAHSSKEIKRISKLYAILSKYYKTSGQPKIALIYADSTILALDSIKRKNNQFRGTNIENTYNKHQVKIASEDELKTKNSNIRSRNIGLFLLSLLLFIGYVIFRKFKLKVKQQESKLENNVRANSHF
jgi:tetratricopeptide (TPR) repeat protein